MVAFGALPFKGRASRHNPPLQGKGFEAQSSPSREGLRGTILPFKGRASRHNPPLEAEGFKTKRMGA
jgi:hypothetical protein